MTQAVCNISTHSKQSVTRRAALTGAAVVAVALPSRAMAGAQCSFPDLAAELDAVRKRYVAHHNLCKAHSTAGKAYATSQTGLFEDHVRALGHESPEWKAFFEAWHKYSEENDSGDPTDKWGNSITWTEINNDLHSICESILALPARSIADLGIQAQAFALTVADFYLDGLDGDENARRLTEALCKFCGIDPIPGLQYPPLSDDAEG